MEGKGRGVVVQESVPTGAFVCEYEAAVTYPRKDRPAHEEEYAKNGEGCYVLDVLTRDGWMCLDATRSFSSVGRLLNHAARPAATLTPYKPLLVGGKWRVGFVAARELMPGDELTWDYGCSPGGLEWLKRCPGQQKCKESVMRLRVMLAQCICCELICCSRSERESPSIWWVAQDCYGHVNCKADVIFQWILKQGKWVQVRMGKMRKKWTTRTRRKRMMKKWMRRKRRKVRRDFQDVHS